MGLSRQRPELTHSQPSWTALPVLTVPALTSCAPSHEATKCHESHPNKVRSTHFMDEDTAIHADDMTYPSYTSL